MSRITSGKLRLDVQPLNPVGVHRGGARHGAAGGRGQGHPPAARRSTRWPGRSSGDPSRLQQVVWNLLSNAIKFTPRDGRVEVTLRRVNSPRRDRGRRHRHRHPAGVPAARLRPLPAGATRSTTRAHGGLGLGLSIVKHLVELHGGTVRAASPGEGQGATFTVSLPLAVRTGSASGRASAGAGCRAHRVGASRRRTCRASRCWSSTTRRTRATSSTRVLRSAGREVRDRELGRGGAGRGRASRPARAGERHRHARRRRIRAAATGARARPRARRRASRRSR